MSVLITFRFTISAHLQAAIVDIRIAAYYDLTCEKVDAPSLDDSTSVLTSVQVGEIEN